MKRMLKPEAEYKVPTKTTIEYLVFALETGTTVTGVPIDYDDKQKVMIIDLGNGYYGKLPFDEISIEKPKYNDNTNIPVQAKWLNKKSAIRTKITKIEGEEICLSRRDNLLEVYEYFLENANIKVDAIVDATANFGVFFDIGEGLIAFCHYTEMSRTKIYPKTFLKVGTKVKVVVYENKNSEGQLNCSIKKASLVNYNEIIRGTKIKVKIGQPIIKNNVLTGYFVEITPSISGIADIEKFKDEYYHYKNGETAYAYVRAVMPGKHKVKLSFK